MCSICAELPGLQQGEERRACQVSSGRLAPACLHGEQVELERPSHPRRQSGQGRRSQIDVRS